MHGAKDVTSPRAVAILHHRAALVFYALSDLARARALAASAVRLADKAAVAGLAARARTSLAVIAGELGDLGTHNRLYAELRELARAASDRSLTFVALMDSFWAEVEAGNVAAADALERELSAFDATRSPVRSTRCRLPTRCGRPRRATSPPRTATSRAR